MNLIAGLLIGFFNDTWMARIAICFIWGIIACIQHWIFGNHNKRNRGTVFQFYQIEYLTATSTAIFGAVVSGAIKAIFIK